MSDSENIVLKLGTIIRIISSSNEELHDNVFIINYLDNQIVELISPNIEEPIFLNIDNNGYFRDKSIETIEILSHPDVEGYAKQNNLLPNKWISIRFGGDLPTTINGQITNLENDMIELTIYPNNTIIYINFDFKGIPRDLPILSIQEIKEPINVSKVATPIDIEKEEKEEQEEGEEQTFDVDEDFEEEQQRAPDDEIKEVLESNIRLGDELVFLEDMGQIEETVNVSNSEKRFGLVEQKNDLLDSLLSDVPTIERTTKLMNFFNKNIQRFDELRTMFSIFDSYNNIIGFKKNDKQVKSIIEHLDNLNKDFKWIVPVVRNKKRLYNIDLDNDDVDLLNIIAEYRTSGVLNEYLKFVNDYNKNEVPEGYNKYYFFISKICKLFDPSELTNDKDQILKEEFIQENIDVILDNLNNFDSYIVDVKVNGNEEVYNVDTSKYIQQRYTKGLTKLNLPDKFTKNFLIEPLTMNDKVSLTGLILMPYTFLDYSKINLFKTSILERANLNFVRYSLKNIYMQNINKRVLTDETIYETDENFLTEPTYYTLQSSINFDDKDSNFYKNFLSKFIPSNREFFNLIKSTLPNKHNYYEIIKSLEPCGIYENNIGFMLYRSIVMFMEEQNLELKKKLMTNTQIYSNYLSYLSNIESVNGLFKVLENTDIFSNNYYKKYSTLNCEILNHIYNVDDGELLLSLICKENIDLQNNIDVDEVIEHVTSETKETNKCQVDYILAKRYTAIEDLREDDGVTIYFDKKYDTTHYDIGKQWMETNISDIGEAKDYDIISKLANHLITNNGIKQEKALRDAKAMLMEKREVENGDIGLLDEIDQELKYYVRKNNKWNIVDEFSGRLMDSINFCNLKQSCIKIKNDCLVDDESKTMIKERLTQEINKHFDEVASLSFEELNKKMIQQFERSSSLLTKKYELRKNKKFLNNYKYNKIASTLEDNTIIVSPLTELRDIILSQNDFINKNKYIIKFVDKFCRPKLEYNDEENEHWYYCVSTNLPLLPTYFHRLALIVMKDISQFKNDYMIELDKIVRERGERSDDGDKFVDKYSGYIIKYIESSNDEGYTEDGYKIVSRDVILASESEQFLNKMQIIDSKFKSPVAKQIMGIIDTLNKNIGITLKSEYNLLIVKNVSSQLKMLQSREDYQIYVAKLAKNEKTAKPYEKYFNEALIYSILSYYSLAIQISIPHITEGKAFKGCAESFIGFPISSNGDTSLIDYIVCVSQKLKSSIAPWNVIPTSRKPAKMEKMKNFVKDKIINILTNFALENDEINELLEEKRNYLLETFSFDTVEEHNLTTWHTFLPIIYTFEPVPNRNLPAGFETNLYNDLINSEVNQTKKLLSLKSKIRNYSFAIQKSVRNIVENQKLILESYKDNSVVPYLENSCCLTDYVSNFQYMVDKDITIQQNNKIVKTMQDILYDVTHLTRAPKMISYENTKFLYPKLENIFSEEVIYTAFIHHCKFEVQELPHPDLTEFCLEKSNGKSIILNKNDTIKEKINYLKDEGIKYSINDFLQLLNLVNRQNIIHINLQPVFLSSRQEFEKVLNSISDSDSCNKDIIQLFTQIMDSYSVEDESKYTYQVSSIIDKKNNQLLLEIIDFFESNKIENLKNKRKNNVLRFLQNFLDFKIIGEGIYYSKEDETGFKVGNIIKQNIYNLLKVFPSIIINETNYENKYPPNHWNLEGNHKNIVSSNIALEFKNFNTFFGKNDLNIFLSNIVDNSELLLKLSDTIPIFMKIENDTILNGTIYKTLMYNVFLCSIKLYIELCNTLETFDIVEEDEENMLIDERIRNERLRGKKEKRNTKVGNFLKEVLSLFYNQKENILNYSNDDIKYMILKAKEKEKEKIKNTLKNMSIEEREVEDYKKQHKLGKWNIGQTSGIFKYDQKTFANELEDLLGDLSDELQIGMNDEVTEMRRQIFGAQMDEVEDIYRQGEDQEIYSLAGLWDDDDAGDADGDEYY